MKKILIAGAGHGGLTAAITLADAGYDVTVVEQKKREDIGHDWHDCLSLAAFDFAGINRPTEDMYHKCKNMAFKSPDSKSEADFEANQESIFMDRKILINYLVDCAEKAGAKFCFGLEIVSPVVKGKTVAGVNVKKGKKEYAIYADLTIDAAGMYSPVRRNLPITCGVKREIEPRDIFHIYRAYYNNTTGETKTPEYIMHPFHNNRPGLDWVWVEKDHVDILIGKFGISGELTPDEITEALKSFKKDYPFIGEEILRGGSINDIPLTKMLPVIVCNGYAAVGDSAGMTIPINGSGIILSMKAGKILADIITDTVAPYRKEDLWKYEYKYFQLLGKDLVIISALKNACTCIDSELVNYMFRTGVMSADVFRMADNQDVKLSPDYIKNAVKSVLPKLNDIAPMIKCCKTVPLIPAIINTMPKEYDEAKVKSWAIKYDAL